MDDTLDEHRIKRWEVSMIEFENTIGKIYKVTKRLPELAVSESRFFRNKEEAKALFNEWAN